MSVLGSVARALCELVLAFIEIILYIAGFSFVVLSILMLYASYYIKFSFDYIDLSKIQHGTLVLFGLGVYLSCLSLFCIYALVTSNRNAIKFFAWMSIVNVVFGLFALAVMYINADDVTHLLEQELNKYMRDYDWKHTSDNNATKLATNAWDRIQSAQHCCGRNSYKDWDAVRPISVDKDTYPTSCCSVVDKDGSCLSGSHYIFQTGCLTTSQALLAGSGIYVMLVIGFSVLIAILSVSKFISCHRTSTNYASY